MKLDAPVNANYCATVIKVERLVELPGLDNLVAIPMFGMQALVSKDTRVGDIGLLFPAEVQLSEEYARLNDLHRHADRNADPDKVGYLEDNRRVRAIKLRGHRSDALFMPLSSVQPLQALPAGTLLQAVFTVGETFDRIGDHEVCRKYERPYKSPRPGHEQRKKIRRVEEKMFPEHFETPQYLRVDRNFDPDREVVITQKIHGTSIRVGNVLVKRRLSLLEKLAHRFGVKVQEMEYATVYGSRKVIKDATDPEQMHYYEHDLWSEAGAKLVPELPRGYIVYAELIGFTGSKPIQKHYTYRHLPGQYSLYVYRVTTVNEQGVVSDLSWDAIKQFCQSLGLDVVPELVRMKPGVLTMPHDMNIERPGQHVYDMFLDRNFSQSAGAYMDGIKWGNAIPLSDDSPCDEGICIRQEAQPPLIAKLKSPLFLQHETKMLDDEKAEDMEAVGAANS